MKEIYSMRRLFNPHFGVWRSLFLVLICWLCTSCVDEIEFEYDAATKRKLAVEASVIKGNPSQIDIRLNFALDFGGFFGRDPLQGGRVYILDEQERRLDIRERSPGIYLRSWEDNQDFSFETGKAYQLHIDSRDGKKYVSNFEKLLEVPSPTDVDIKLVIKEKLNEQENIVNQPYLQYFVNTPLISPNEGGRVNLKWDFAGVSKFPELENPNPFAPPSKTCYISLEVNRDKIVVLDGQNASADQVEGHFLLEQEVGSVFSRGYYLTVLQQSLSEGAYTYWNQVSQAVSRTGSIVENPVGKIFGNIQNVNDDTEEVLGYFYLTEVDTLYRYVDPEVAGFPTYFCNLFGSYEGAVEQCRNCLDQPASTTRKPDYWVE